MGDTWMQAISGYHHRWLAYDVANGEKVSQQAG
jgi:hypothetical protein